MKTTYVKILLLISIVTTSVSAQSMLGYQYPTGIPATPSTGMSLSMGGTGTGIQNDWLQMTKNPANLGIVKRAVFSSVLALDFQNIHDNGQTSTQFLVEPQIIAFSFPLNKFGAIGLSVDQRSITNLKFKLSDNISTGSGLPGITNDLGIVRKGGEVSWQAGWGYSILNRALIGVTYERFYFTNITNRYKQTSGALDSKITDSTEVLFGTNGIRAGLLIPYKKLTAGISGEYLFKNKADSHRFVNGIDPEKVDLGSEEFSFKPAPSLSLGLSYQFSPEWIAAADLTSTFWKEFYAPQQEIPRPLENALSVSAGTQYIPAPNLLSPKYFEIMQYRAGFRYSQLPVSTASEFVVDLGLGLPLQQNGSIIDINLEYGRRWDSNYDKYSEEIIGIKLGINGGRKWYQQASSSY